jgi:hypothetical protein
MTARLSVGWLVAIQRRLSQLDGPASTDQKVANVADGSKVVSLSSFTSLSWFDPYGWRADAGAFLTTVIAKLVSLVANRVNVAKLQPPLIAVPANKAVAGQSC